MSLKARIHNQADPHCLILLFACIFFFSSPSQILFNKLPQDLAFIPRKQSNKGEVEITGRFVNTIYSELRCVLMDMKNDSVLEEKKARNVFPGWFQFNFQLEAAFREFKIKLYAKETSGESLIKEIKNLVCGDVFLMGGQSNALDAKGLEKIPTPLDLPHYSTAREFSPQNALYSHPYCRSLGFNMNYALEKEKKSDTTAFGLTDNSWAYPSCTYWDCGFVGAWAIKLQHDLSEALKVPLCFVNGAYAGADIQGLLPSLLHQSRRGEELNKPYDRVYTKLKNKGLLSHVKGIFWYQGEADGALEYEEANQYSVHFNDLYKHWKIDYPNCNQVFLIQTNTACGGRNLGLVRDLQTEIAEEFPEVEIMSTVGSSAEERNQQDACHNTTLGSNRLADKLLPLVLNTLYGYSFPKNRFYPPKVKQAYFSEEGSSIRIVFDQAIYLQSPRTLTYTAPNNKTVEVEEKLENYFFDESGKRLEIDNLKHSENEIQIRLKPGICRPNKITYLPSTYYHESNYLGRVPPVYAGPWIMNQFNTLGALSFYNLDLNCEKQSSATRCCNAIAAFPNPSRGGITVMSGHPNKKDLSVYNSAGTRVLSTAFWEERFYLDMGGFPKGLYFFQIASENETPVCLKIVLED